MVAHAYNPSYLGGRSRRISIQGGPGEKYPETLSEIQAKLKRARGASQVVE
jgi:hypothetical protein